MGNAATGGDRSCRLDHLPAPTRLLAHVFELQPKAVLSSYTEGADSSEEGAPLTLVDQLLRSRLESALQAEAVICDDNDWREGPKGRLGPLPVTFDRSSGTPGLHITNHGTTVEGRSGFSSCRASVCVFSGKWMYEATLGTAGLQQIGWATINCSFTNENGVGDSHFSYAFDGKRVRKWHVHAEQYGKPWASGDVIGCCIDLEQGHVSYYRNGKPLGVAFKNVKGIKHGLAYFPAVSLSRGESSSFNFGATPFRFQIPGFQPLQPPPSELSIELVDYLMGSFRRLVHARVEDERFQLQHAAFKVKAAGESPRSHEVDLHHEGSMDEDQIMTDQEAFLDGQTRDEEVGASLEDVRRHGSGQPVSQAGGGALRPLRHLLGASGREERRTESSGGFEAPEFPCSEDDAVIMASIIWQYMIPFLNNWYLFQGKVVSGLMELYGRQAPHDAAALHSALNLLELVLSPETFQAVMAQVFESVAEQSPAHPLMLEEYPYTGPYPFLAITCGILNSNKTACKIWLTQEGVFDQVEHLFIRKLPSMEDIEGLIPQVVFTTGPGHTAEDERQFRDSVQGLTRSMQNIEQLHLELASHLIRGSRDILGHPGPENMWLRFVRKLLNINRAIGQDVQVPGMSNATVLTSSYFVLLQLLREFVDGRRWSDRLRAFPAGEMFVKGRAVTERAAGIPGGHPVLDLPRVGGLISVLQQERPLLPRDMEPVIVDIPISPDSPAASTCSPPPPAAATATVRIQNGKRKSHSLNDNDGEQDMKKEVDMWMERERDIRQAPAGSRSPTSPPEEPSLIEDAWLPELFNATMMFYGWRMAASIRSAQNVSKVLVVNAASLEDMEALVAQNPQAKEFKNARDMVRKEVMANVRYLAMSKVTIFAPWKQNVMLQKCAYLANLLRAISTQHPNLLGYVPMCYMQAPMDTLLALKHPESPFAVLTEAIPEHQLHPFVSFISEDLGDERIAVPDLKEEMIHCVSTLLENKDTITVFENNTIALSTLVPSLLTCFDSKMWQSISDILIKLVQGTGFGEVSGDEETAALCSGRKMGSKVFQERLCNTVLTKPEVTDTFLDRLFNTLNLLLTEFVSIITDVHEHRTNAAVARRRGARVDLQASYKRAATLYDVAIELLRILEFLTRNVSSVFLRGSRGAIALQRLIELISFLLSHFTVGADARRLNELLQRAPGTSQSGSQGAESSGAQEESLVNRIPKAAVLAPVVGMLAGLERAEQAWRSDHDASTSAVMAMNYSQEGREKNREHSFLNALVNTRDGTMVERLKYTARMDWDKILYEINKTEQDQRRLLVISPNSGAPENPGRAVNQFRAMNQLLQRSASARARSAFANDAGFAYPEAQMMLEIQPGQHTQVRASVSEAQRSASRDLHRSTSAVLHRATSNSEDLQNPFAVDPRGLSQSSMMSEPIRAASSSPSFTGEGWSLEALIHRKISPDLDLLRELIFRLEGELGRQKDRESSSMDVDIPDEFLDPITSQLMSDPVILPDSHVIVDRSTIQRHLFSQKTDPFTRSELTMDMVQPDDVLRQRIEQWHLGDKR